MNNANTDKLRGSIELLLENSSRINEAKPEKYWHPLAMATYGIDEIIEAVDSLCSFRTTMWEKTLEFEARFATWQGRRHAIMVNSGSSANLLLCFALLSRAAGVLKPGDEILVPVVTWPTQIWSPMMAGLKVRLVDVDPDALNTNQDILAKNISERTKAVFLVHLMGIPCPMQGIQTLVQDYNLLLIEDCCEALGAEYCGRKTGNFGLAATFSFFFAHHFVTMEGGMIVTDDDALDRQLRIMRAHGWLRNVGPKPGELDGYNLDPRYAFVNWGFNLRPTELQAGFGLHQLRKIDEWNVQRRALAARFYDAVLKDNPWLSAPEYNPLAAQPCWFALPIMVRAGAPFARRQLTEFLEQSGVETRPIVAGNIARHPVAKLFNEFDGDFPGADAVHQHGFYIGLSPMTTKENINGLIGLFRQFTKTVFMP